MTSKSPAFRIIAVILASIVLAAALLAISTIIGLAVTRTPFMNVRLARDLIGEGNYLLFLLIFTLPFLAVILAYLHYASKN